LILDWTELAGKDKEGYIEYIAQDNPLAAVHVGDEIERQVETLLQHPKIGRAGRVKGTRELVIVGTPAIPGLDTTVKRRLGMGKRKVLA